jgi:hypothetical protein
MLASATLLQPRPSVGEYKRPNSTARKRFMTGRESCIIQVSYASDDMRSSRESTRGGQGGRRILKRVYEGEAEMRGKVVPSVVKMGFIEGRMGVLKQVI